MIALTKRELRTVSGRIHHPQDNAGLEHICAKCGAKPAVYRGLCVDCWWNATIISRTEIAPCKRKPQICTACTRCPLHDGCGVKTAMPLSWSKAEAPHYSGSDSSNARVAQLAERWSVHRQLFDRGRGFESRLSLHTPTRANGG